jgi:hypothetical protein
MNGVQFRSSYTFSTNFSSGGLTLGAFSDARTAEGHHNGNIGGIRFTQGVGRYTGNFDVPTAPFPEA